jgi:hypothetical protein
VPQCESKFHPSHLKRNKCENKFPPSLLKRNKFVKKKRDRTWIGWTKKKKRDEHGLVGLGCCKTLVNEKWTLLMAEMLHIVSILLHPQSTSHSYS